MEMASPEWKNMTGIFGGKAGLNPFKKMEKSLRSVGSVGVGIIAVLAVFWSFIGVLWLGWKALDCIPIIKNLIRIFFALLLAWFYLTIAEFAGSQWAKDVKEQDPFIQAVTPAAEKIKDKIVK